CVFYPHFWGKYRRLNNQIGTHKQPRSNILPGSMELLTIHCGNLPSRLLIFGNANLTRVNQPRRKQKFAFSTPATQSTSAFTAMTHNLLESLPQSCGEMSRRSLTITSRF